MIFFIPSLMKKVIMPPQVNKAKPVIITLVDYSNVPLLGIFFLSSDSNCKSM